jgi:hypothetical protein
MALEAHIERQTGLAIVTAWPMAVVLKLGFEGWPDRLVLLGEGQSFFIEFKQKGRSLRPDQLVRIRDLVTAGNVTVVIDTVEDGQELAEVIHGARSACRALAAVALWAAHHAPTLTALRASGTVRRPGGPATTAGGSADARARQDRHRRDRSS